jgi:hypothetical protein
LHAISGEGALGVGNGATASILTADSIQVDTLRIGAGSKVTIAPLPGGPLVGRTLPVSVPEPSAIALLITAALGILFYCDPLHITRIEPINGREKRQPKSRR